MKFLCLPLLVMAMTSCIHENDVFFEEETETYGKGDVTIIVHFSPLAMSRAGNQEVVEKIQSIRLIMLSDEGVEANIYKSWGGGSYNAENFSYVLRLQATAGTKQFYFFANEESVSEIMYQPVSGVTLPTGLPDNFSDLLESLTVYDETDPGYSSSEVSSILNSVYYEPEYTISNNVVYLPYSSTYEKTALPSSPENPIINEYTMFMVPDAVKFSFNFINNRYNDINITEIIVSGIGNNGITYPENAGISNLNFLNANVNSTDLFKTYNNVSYYWIDWLAQIAMLSQEHPGAIDNNNFNNLFGWIEDYNLPASSVPSAATLFADQSNPLVIPGTATDDMIGDNIPVIVGPYYLPESNNPVSYLKKGQDGRDMVVTEQQYYLTLGINEPMAQELPPEFKNEIIPNLKALFRDTHEIITIRFTEGDVEVYAEIAGWNPKTANGWVVGGN